MRTHLIRPHLLMATAVAAALLAATSSTRAQTNWTGAMSSDWFTAGNWNPGVVPTGTTTTNIDTVTPNATVVTAPTAAALGVTVGNTGTGMLTIQSGGTLNNANISLGFQTGSQGTVTVTGMGSTLTTSATVGVGLFGTGTFTVQNGGTVSVGNQTVIGDLPGSQGTVTVTGAGSTWTTNGGTTIGSTGTGTLTISNGGTVTVGSGAGTVFVANQAGSTGTLNIGAVPGDPATAPGTLNAATVSFGAGTGTINFNHTATDYVFTPAISGDGSVNVFAGVTTLTANNTYTGPTTVNGGALFVDGSIANSSVTVNSGETLGGTGTVGPTLIND